MNRLLAVPVLFAGIARLAAADPVPPPVDYAAIAEAGTGVYKVELDKQGRIQSCLIVGQSTISTVLGAAEGKQIARKKAELAARGAFVKWMKEEVRVYEKNETEVILVKEGAEGGGANANSETGKLVDKTTTRIESIATGLVRGMKVAHLDINAADKTYTLVYKWDVKQVAAAADAEDIQKNPPRVGTPATPPTEKKPDPKSPQLDKKITDKKVTIPD